MNGNELYELLRAIENANNFVREHDGVVAVEITGKNVGGLMTLHLSNDAYISLFGETQRTPYVDGYDKMRINTHGVEIFTLVERGAKDD